MFDNDLLVLDERGPGVLLAGGSMVTSISNYMNRSKDPDALERQVRRWTTSINQARSDFADATPPAGQPKLEEFLRPRGTMPQPLLLSSGTSATSAVPSAVPTAVPSTVPSDKTAAPKDITANPRLAKFLMTVATAATKAPDKLERGGFPDPPNRGEAVAERRGKIRAKGQPEASHGGGCLGERQVARWSAGGSGRGPRGTRLLDHNFK